MSQKGTHTWEISLHYYSCPKCGEILEDRQEYEYNEGQYQKQLECWRCREKFTVTKATHLRFGPLIGDPQPVEFMWDGKKDGA